MISWQPKRFMKFFGASILVVCIILGAVISSAYILLSRGPIDLQFLKPHISSTVAGIGQHEGIDFKSLTLSCEGIGRPLVLEATDLSLQSSHSPLKRVYVPHMKLKYKLHQVLLLQKVPRETYLESPDIEYDLSKVTAKSSAHSLYEQLEQFSEVMHEILSFKRLVVQNAHVQINPLDSSYPVIIQANINLIRKDKHIYGEIQGNSPQGCELKGVIRYDQLKAKTYVRLDGANINTPLILGFIPALKSWGASCETLSGQLRLLHSFKSGVEACTLGLAIKGVKVAPNGYFKNGLTAPGMNLKASLSDDEVALNAFEIQLNNATIKTQGIGKLHREDLHFDTHTTLVNLPVNELEYYWPQQAAKAAREWVTENIRDGQIPSAFLRFAGNFDLKHSRMTLDHLGGSIELQDARLCYINAMPKIEKLNAIADFDHDHFDFKIKSASCSRLGILGGSVIIGKLSDPTTHLSLSIDLKGQLSDVLYLINHRPLQYASQFNLVPAKTSGNVTGQLKMTFPLELPFHSEKILTDVKVAVEKAVIKQVVGLPVDLKDGALDVAVTDQKLSVKGKGLLNDSQGDLLIEKFFPSSKSEMKETCQLNLNLHPKSVKDFGLSLTNTVQGLMPTEITFTNTIKNEGTLNIKADLTKTIIKVFNVVKPMKKHCALIVQAKMKDYQFVQIPKIEIKSIPEIYINGNASFIKGINTLKSANFSQMKIGDSELSVAVTFPKNQQYHLDIHGKTVDLSQYLQDNTGEDALNFDNIKPLTVHFRADRLKLGGTKDLLDSDMTARIEHGIVKSMLFSSILEGVKDTKNIVEMAIEPLPHHMRRFSLKTDQAGAFFMTLGIFENVRKGRLRLVALHDDYAIRSSWEGKLTMIDFSLLNAPFMSHFVSLAFPTGLADLTKGGGLGFNYFKAKFIARPRTLVISAGRAYGYSLGFTFNGTLERGKRGRVNMQGSIIPAYFINTLISKIPLLGELIVGEKHGGLWGLSFKVTGSKDDPQVFVNPLSALTPGILRKIFVPFDDSDSIDPFGSERDVIDDNDKDLGYDDVQEQRG